MAQATCSRCSGTLFETKELTPRGATYPFRAIQCIMFGTVAGIVDTLSVSTQLQEQHARFSRFCQITRELVQCGISAQTRIVDPTNGTREATVTRD